MSLVRFRLWAPFAGIAHLVELGIEISVRAQHFIVENGYDPVYGARPLKRYIQKYVETLAARLILADQVRAGDTILIELDSSGTELTALTK